MWGRYYVKKKEAIHDNLDVLRKSLEKTFEPVVVRHFILTSHYRQPLDFSSEALKGAESGSYKLRDAARELSRAARDAPLKPRCDQVRDALADILNFGRWLTLLRR